MKFLKIFLIFATGAGAGVGGSAFFFKRKYEKFYREKADKELAEMDEYYRERLEEKEKEEVKEEPAKQEEPEEKPARPIAPEQKRQGSFAHDYTKHYGDDAEQEHPEDDMPVEAPIRREPKWIKKSLFGTDGYATRVLYYYTDDDALVSEGDSEEEIMEVGEVSDAISTALIKIGFTDEGNLDREIFIRNYDRKTDYHVIKVIGSLSDEYGG